MTTNEIRQAFLEFFKKKQHSIIASSNLVPINDTTLLFTNAGMVQFKDIFLGTEIPTCKRAVTIQKCMRAGGKHNDLDNVGYTARHHTFFEMLGNFSFGDYFKRDAINYAWEFVTQVLKLPTEKLWVTVFKDDHESADIWLKEIKISPNRFSYCDAKDNFWSMGETGPCGPCTEIFYDHGPTIAGGPPGSPDADGDRYIELWNLVFMQYNRDYNGKLHLLPNPCVDTGMGLERVAAVMQDVHSNYQIDVFQKIIQGLSLNLPNNPQNLPSLNVVADHIRSICFLIAEDILPSNEGRGYVLRRIIRRAIRHANKLGASTNFFTIAVELLINVMQDQYPELIHKQALIIDCLSQEEQQFSKTLDQGLLLINQYLVNLEGQTIPGALAFKLYDTYGFPLDLTQDLAREHGLQVDVEGFEHAMHEQVLRSKSATNFGNSQKNQALSTVKTAFHGYEKNQMIATIQEIIVDDHHVNTLSQPARAIIILDHTPFYAESGGQIGDKGKLYTNNGVFIVNDTQKIGDTIYHYGELISGDLSIQDSATAEIMVDYRNAVRANHTATHLLHAALKQILGEQVQQKGSLVNAQISRFDFSHLKPLSHDQIYALEHLVNLQIRKNLIVETAIMDLNQAKQQGATALFGEKYQDTVRVLSVGDFSKELCGGTHVNRTGDIGFFKIITEYSVASGVRRIEFVTAEFALTWVNKKFEILNDLSSFLKTSAEDLTAKISQILADLKQQQNLVIAMQKERLQYLAKDLVKLACPTSYGFLLIEEIVDVETKFLRDLLDYVKQELKNCVVLLYIVTRDQLHVVCGINGELQNFHHKPIDLVRKLCGKGGGKDNFAQGGSSRPHDLDVLINNMKNNLLY